MTNDIRILSVLRKYYEEKALSTNSQEDADIHNALLHAIKVLESSIHIPSNATNGDVIKAVFGAEFIRNTLYGVVIDLDGEIELSDDWWYAPYKEDKADE